MIMLKGYGFYCVVIYSLGNKEIRDYVFLKSGDDGGKLVFIVFFLN